MASIASSTAPPKTPSTLFNNPSKAHHHRRPSIIDFFKQRRLFCTNQRVTRASSAAGVGGVGGSSSPGLYSAETFELTAENADLVLDEVRTFLFARICLGVITAELLQAGACESCPSSTTTMKMGIERVLKEKFGDTVKEIWQVFDEQPTQTTVEAVNRHLDILRPAIKNFGGSVKAISVNGSDCIVNYTGPESIGSGIKAAIKEKFPDILNVVLT